MQCDDIKEGFWCPICKHNCYSSTQLYVHFSTVHCKVSKDVPISQIKDMFDRAKQRIFKSDGFIECLEASVVNKSSICQELGVTTSQTRYFKKLRHEHVDISVAETNKLVIRLDKLINNEYPMDINKRKGTFEIFEQTVVPWISNDDVKLCQFCEVKFSLTRRRHHCRLCGKILCSDCCIFISLDFAKKLTNPAFAAAYKLEKLNMSMNMSNTDTESDDTSSSEKNRISSLTEKAGQLFGSFTKLRKENVENSSSSLTGKEADFRIRICNCCALLLNRREQQLERCSTSPMIVELYESLQSYIAEVEKLHPTCVQMASSLGYVSPRLSSNICNLHLQQWRISVRARICPSSTFQVGHLASTSRQCQVGVEPSVNEDHCINHRLSCCCCFSSSDNICKLNVASCKPKQQLLQRNVRMAMVTLMQKVASSTPTLPSESEYKVLNEQYRERMRKEFEEGSRRYAEMMESRLERIGGDRSSISSSTDGTTKHLLDDDSATDFDDIEPLKQQIYLIKEYIKQAAMSGNLHEVNVLQTNLHELEEELTLQETKNSFNR
ncbi:Rabenosyn-5 [Trichinella spiralis]|uniref:Rabenosyn-5 n=1 Tax=Trichinella spiralis TaxID=6334 RepID=A0A0V1BDY7_TRISP|nr:Rabenosyn-5 [Trichinella spiralis]